MTGDELKIIQSYPLNIKIEKSKARLREWVKHWGLDGTYISFSGGKDSTVLLDLARQEYPDLKAVFCDTGLEYPEVKEFVKSIDNVEIIRPKKTFKEVLTKYGYPVVSKENSSAIYEIRNTKSEYMLNRRLNGNENGMFALPQKWRYLIDAPFLISSKCCYHLKKSPFYSYDNKHKTTPITGTLAEESWLRRTAYLRAGCNAFNATHPRSQPLSFWTNQDILEYINQNNLKIADCYGEIKRDEEEKLYMDGVDRTGCVFCAYGCHRDKCPNRYQKLKKSHPKLYNYCIEGGQYNQDGMWIPSNEGLGFGKVLDYLNIDY